ncbi:hypothetical protein [Haloferula rosea]|uniref:Uncharacterized protein n=1 Tax=Haloferula rosea TaxID=490093 RepID=A0A934VCD1_9BACT|nr:hypothetical protein [Haloferula rosea]MBK1828318.1 hypothetical protein [Haloferula rosea]
MKSTKPSRHWMIFGKPRTGESREAFKKRVRESLIERGVFSRETGKLIQPGARRRGPQ